jgi:formate-dependent nitrite reductase membrane component NrfD
MVRYTAQTDWIRGGGLLIWLSFFTGILGSGSYLVSLYFDSAVGTTVSWLIIVVLKGGLHVVDARRPLGLWRMVLRVKTSWIARGMVFTICLAFFGVAQILLAHELPGSSLETAAKAAAGVAAAAVLLYEVFTINYVGGIPLWNSALLPATLISWGIFEGLAVVGVAGSQMDGGRAAEVGNSIMLGVTALLTLLYLWNAAYAGATSKESVKKITTGGLSVMFWIGTVVIGFAASAVILLSGFASEPVGRIMLLVLEAIGCLSFTYAVFRAGLYSPLV